jgi:hypothetical protein
MGSPLFLSDLLSGNEPALAADRELSQLAALRQATRLGRFSTRANFHAAVWDKPRSSLQRREKGRFMESSHGLKKPRIGTMSRNEPGRRPALRFMESFLFLSNLLTVHEPALAADRELSQLAALRQATRPGRFSTRANFRAAVWDKPCSSLQRREKRRFIESSHGLKKPRIGTMSRNEPGRRPALRFMERGNGAWLNKGLSGPGVSA